MARDCVKKGLFIIRLLLFCIWVILPIKKTETKLEKEKKKIVRLICVVFL